MDPKLLRLVAVLIVVSGCAPDPTDRLPEAPALYRSVFLIAVAIFIVVEAVIVYSSVRYRHPRRDDDLPPPTHGNALAEVAWTFVPLIITLVILFLAWQALTGVD